MCRGSQAPPTDRLTTAAALRAKLYAQSSLSCSGKGCSSVHDERVDAGPSREIAGLCWSARNARVAFVVSDEEKRAVELDAPESYMEQREVVIY